MGSEYDCLTNEQLVQLAEFRRLWEQAMLAAHKADRLACSNCGGDGKVNKGFHGEPPDTCPTCHGTGEVTNFTKKTPPRTLELRLLGEGQGAMVRVQAINVCDEQPRFLYSYVEAQETLYQTFTVDVATRTVKKGIRIQALEHRHKRIQLGDSLFRCPWIDLSALPGFDLEVADTTGQVVMHPRPDCLSLTVIAPASQMAQDRGCAKPGAILAVRNLHRVTGKRIWTEGSMIVRGGPYDTRDNFRWEWDDASAGFQWLAIEEKAEKTFRHASTLTTSLTHHRGQSFSPKFALVALEYGCEIHAHYAQWTDEVPYPVVQMKWNGTKLSFEEFKHPISPLDAILDEPHENSASQK